MGLFSSKKKTYVDTAVVRVVEDEYIPNTVTTAVVGSLFQGGAIADRIMFNALNGEFHGFERMYRWAAEPGNYFYGLPNVRLLSSTSGEAHVQTILDALVGYPVTIEYAHYRPPNNIHLGWEEITNNYGYDEATNTLAVLSAQIGHTVYLDKMVAVHYLPLEDGPDNNARGNFRRSTQAGATPIRTARGSDPALAQLVAEEEFLEGPEYTESVQIHYVWLDSADVLQSDFFVVDLSAYDGDNELYQAKYHYTDASQVTHVKYWTYNPEDALHPALDSLYALNYINPGTYFPFAVFRREKQDRTADAVMASEEFLSTEKLLKKLGVNFKEMGDSINENEGIADVEQAVMLMGVPITTTDQVELEYLFNYFNQIEDLMPQSSQDLNSLTDLSYGNDASYALEIADADFRVVLSFEGIKKSYKAGNIGPIGTYENFVTEIELPGGDGVTVSRIPNQKHTSYTRYIRKQITSGVYQEIVIDQLKTRYDIYKGKGVIGMSDDERCLIPLDYNVAKQSQLLDRERLYYRSLHLVFNSRVTVKVKWYETSFFRAVLTIAAIYLTIVSLGKTWKAVVAAASLGAAAVVVVTAIIKALVIKFALKAAVRVIGVDAAFLLAIAAALAGEFGSFEMISADTLMQLASGLADASAAVSQELFSQYSSQLQEFNLMAEEKWAELEEVSKLLDTNNLLDPFAFIGKVPDIRIGESADDFYTRTVHMTNPGVAALDIIENYVDISLTLPGIDKNPGDSFYV